MAATRASVLPFICTNPNLPRVRVLPPKIEGALLQFSAEQSPLGSVLSSSVQNYGSASSPLTFTSTGTAQTVEEGGRRFWRFDGGAANVSGIVNATGYTRFLRVRARETFTSTGKVLLGAGAAGGQSVSGSLDRFFLFAGTRLQGPAIPPATGWHTVIGVFNGASSLIEVDGVAVSGPAGSNFVNGFRLAASGAMPYEYASIDVSAAGLFPGVAGPEKRAEIRDALEF